MCTQTGTSSFMSSGEARGPPRVLAPGRRQPPRRRGFRASAAGCRAFPAASSGSGMGATCGEEAERVREPHSVSSVEAERVDGRSTPRAAAGASSGQRAFSPAPAPPPPSSCASGWEGRPARKRWASSVVGKMPSGHAACSTRCIMRTTLTSALPTNPDGLSTMAQPRMKRSIRSPSSLAQAMYLRTWRMAGTAAFWRSMTTSTVESTLRAMWTRRSVIVAIRLSRSSSVMALLVNFSSMCPRLPCSEYVTVMKGFSTVRSPSGPQSGTPRPRVYSVLPSGLRQRPSGGRPSPSSAWPSTGVARQLGPLSEPGLWSWTAQPLGPFQSTYLTLAVWHWAILACRHLPSPIER
mmetsp:Transcript_94312/g.304549  ORF Transcript_94312/g.304549 Transcript_94312/m.304549 type:complete len:351 (+) Transcript_94312:101-1153(+)